MTIETLLSITSDQTTIKLYDGITGGVIAVYDGKNSIPVGYNDETVKKLFVANNMLYVEV